MPEMRKRRSGQANEHPRCPPNEVAPYGLQHPRPTVQSPLLQIVVITFRRDDSDGESTTQAPLSLSGRGAGGEGLELVFNRYAAFDISLSQTFPR